MEQRMDRGLLLTYQSQSQYITYNLPGRNNAFKEKKKIITVPAPVPHALLQMTQLNDNRASKLARARNKAQAQVINDFVHYGKKCRER